MSYFKTYQQRKQTCRFTMTGWKVELIQSTTRHEQLSQFMQVHYAPVRVISDALKHMNQLSIKCAQSIHWHPNYTHIFFFFLMNIYHIILRDTLKFISFPSQTEPPVHSSSLSLSLSLCPNPISKDIYKLTATNVLCSNTCQADESYA